MQCVRSVDTVGRVSGDEFGVVLSELSHADDAAIVAQKILSCVARTDQRFGVGHLISVLRGENTDAVRKWGHARRSRC